MLAPPSRRIALAALALAPLLAACARDLDLTFDPPVVCRPLTQASSSVFLIGDAGAAEVPRDGSAELLDPVLLALSQGVADRVALLGAERTAVVFLGDNVYPAGLAPPDHPDRARGERILDAQVAAVGAARGIFVLGNHDWNGAKADGYERATAQASYLDAVAPNVELQPVDGCPGPGVVDFGPDLRLVFGDVWSAIYALSHPESPLASCPTQPGGGRIASDIKQAFDEANGRRVVFAVHPPLMMSGPHGGYFPWREHLFPLRVFHRSLWIPLPILGSIFPLARWSGVTDTDLMSTPYRRYVEIIRDIFEPGVPALVVGGHDHSLQVHIDEIGVFHAVSGAGSASKVDYVRDLRSDLMSLAAPGFMRLDSYGSGRLTLTVFALDDGMTRRVYRTCIP